MFAFTFYPNSSAAVTGFLIFKFYHITKSAIVGRNALCTPTRQTKKTPIFVI